MTKPRSEVMQKFPVNLPQFGESAAEATVVTWLVQTGQNVAADQELVEVQTEKSVMTVTAPIAGVLEEQSAKPNQRVAVGGILGYLLAAEGSAMPAVHAPGLPSSTSASAAAAISNVPAHSRFAFSAELAAPLAPGPDYISPRLRARMAEAGLTPADLALIPGSGNRGRVTARDLEHFLAKTEGTTISPIRLAVASSMARSWTRPLATVAREVRLDALLAHRRDIEGRPSATVYALRALALGLAEDDRLACKLIGNRLVRPASLDLAFAVEVNDGVLTPVIKRVNTLSLAEIAAECHEATIKARTRNLIDAVGPSVATVSNYGTFGITWATPIPLPGQALILGLGSMRNAPDWNPATKTWDKAREAELTLTFDHRIADGGGAARLLHKIAELLEHPGKL
jgi:pyruvate/2-oxoglutarate dehydrogenase complex dihydrolipoamide acyltransferase (E2) component